MTPCFQKRISDSCFQKPTNAQLGCDRQSPLRVFGFGAVLHCLQPVFAVRYTKPRALVTRSRASMSSALGAGRDTPRDIRG
jgi:hypothetical protein